jgi:hypothetical protein
MTAPVPPLLRFDQAEAIGADLHAWMVQRGWTPPMAADCLGWADTVQFIVRRARDGVTAGIIAGEMLRRWIRLGLSVTVPGWRLELDLVAHVLTRACETAQGDGGAA